MDEGKVLLYQVIENKINKLSDVDNSSILIDNVNLKELLDLIIKDYNNFYLVNDNILNSIINDDSMKNASSFKIELIKIRDLLIGKTQYNLKVTLSQEYEDKIRIFIKQLNKYINNVDPDIVNKEIIIKKIQTLKKKVDNNFLINEFDLINELVSDYDYMNADKNMIIIMKYINEMNLTLLKMKKKNAPVFDVQMIRRPKLASEVKEVLDRIKVDPKELPNYLLSELKHVDPQEFVATYNIIKKNKAENGGILHFFRKEDAISKVLLILYSNEMSIITVVNSVKDNKGVIDIKALKNIINIIPSVFYIKKNAYFADKHDNYITNVQYLKKLKVNYRALISKNPLFMIQEHEVLDYTLNYLENLGADKKNVVNRCYKLLAINPAILIENIDALRLHGLDTEEYFSPENTNYNLLKIPNLDKKVKYIMETNNVNLPNTKLDYELLNKLILNKVYKEAHEGVISWGDEA